MDYALMDIGGGVGFFGTLVIGILAGWAAEKITKARHGLFTNLILGIAGAYVGAFLANLAGIRLGELFQGWFWGNLIVAIVGAVVLIMGYRLLTSKGK